MSLRFYGLSVEPREDPERAYFQFQLLPDEGRRD
jgi:hypothetical protein